MSQEPLTPRPELLEGLKERNPDLELWWDAHPGYYQVFLANLREKGVDDATLSVLHRFMSHNEGGVFFFDGVTTNPPLVLRLLESRPQVVARVQEFGRVFSSDTRPRWFDLYLMVGKLGADKFLSNFYRRDRQYGFVCLQVDPRKSTDEATMVLQALEISRTSPNLMVKIPATRAGLTVMEEIISFGVPVNATSCFCVPQVVQVARAMKRGYEKGKARGVDYSAWRAVITMMLGRWEAATELTEEAKAKGVTLEEADLRFFGILMAKRAVDAVKALGAPAKVLVCSTRKGPGSAYLHLEELAKLPIVITMNPEALEWGMTLLREERARAPFEVPRTTEEKLHKLDFARRSLEFDGFTMEDIATSSAQIHNLREFSQAMERIERILSAQ
jgi:transaldolase